MKPLVSVIVPAWNEAERLSETLQALHRARSDGAKEPTELQVEIITVDDGSRDSTWEAAWPWSDIVLCLPVNAGKAAALSAGWKAASGELIVFLDADLGDTASHFPAMLIPLLQGKADFVVAKLPPAVKKGGLGLVKTLARQGVRRLSGYDSGAPLSGQRAMRVDILRKSKRTYKGFGMEVGMLIDAVNQGYRVIEMEVPFAHRETGRDWKSWLHRGKQFFAITRTLWHCWRRPVC